MNLRKEQQFRSLFMIAIGLILSIPATPAIAATATENEAMANMITVLFRAARKVISDNQALINDPDKGDKGLTAEKVIAGTKENFAKTMGKDVDSYPKNSLSGEAIQAMLKSVGKVVNDNQALINEKGKGFKGFIPASFARQTASEFTSMMKGKVAIKLTAPKAIIRNRANRPDEWEHTVMEQKFRKADYPKGEHFGETAQFDGKKAYRFLSPEYYAASCLNCHGEPKGERDISGNLKEGSKLGELGGATSVAIF